MKMKKYINFLWSLSPFIFDTSIHPDFISILSWRSNFSIASNSSLSGSSEFIVITAIIVSKVYLNSSIIKLNFSNCFHSFMIELKKIYKKFMQCLSVTSMIWTLWIFILYFKNSCSASYWGRSAIFFRMKTHKPQSILK